MKHFKKAFIPVLIVLTICFSSCGCRHNWNEATCTTPKTCTLCGMTEGSTYGHNYVDGYCINCNASDPDFFNAKLYGFNNTYGMNIWMEITSYSINKANATATYTEQGYHHKIYKFQDGVLYNYMRYETRDTTDHKNLTQNLDETEHFTIISNDSISVDGNTWTIFERATDQYGHLILKVKVGSKERWFMLADQINWEKSPTIEDYEHGWKEYTYYFSN